MRVGYERSIKKLRLKLNFICYEMYINQQRRKFPSEIKLNYFPLKIWFILGQFLRVLMLISFLLFSLANPSSCFKFNQPIMKISPLSEIRKKQKIMYVIYQHTLIVNGSVSVAGQPASFLKTDPGTEVFLWILRDFVKQFFGRTPVAFVTWYCDQSDCLIFLPSLSISLKNSWHSIYGGP